jgi:putative ABC transport system permease protein
VAYPSGHRRAAAILALASRIVPAARRIDWRREWDAEMWQHLSARPGAWPAAAGAFRHACAIRLQHWRPTMIATDIRHAMRGLVRRRGLTALVIVLLAGGITLATTMFTVINSVLLEPLPFPAADRLMWVFGVSSLNQSAGVSAPDLVDFRADSASFTSIAGFESSAPAVLTRNGGAAESVYTMNVTADYFRTLALAPFVGRFFHGEDEGRNDVVVLSYALWHRRYGADPGIVGQNIMVDGAAAQVVGVLPSAFDRVARSELFRPFDFHAPHAAVRAYHTMGVIARLAPGVWIDRGEAALNITAAQLAHNYPEDRGWRVRLTPYQDVITMRVAGELTLLAAAVAMVMLIACGNIGALLVARAAARQRDIGVRVALGATRTDIVRFALIECLLLGIAGGSLGMAGALALVHLIQALPATVLPRVLEVTISWRVLGFTAAASVASALLFGVAPAWQSARLASLSAGAVSHTNVRRRYRDVVVAGQTALSLVLLIAGGLMTRTLWRLHTTNPGFRAEGVLTAQLTLPAGRYQYDQLAPIWNRYLDAVRVLPGVVDASASNKLLMASFGGNAPVWAPNHPPQDQSQRGLDDAEIDVVAPHYFATLQIPVLAGRVPPGDETDNGVYVSRSLARRLYPLGDALGKPVTWDFGTPQSTTILAIVGDVKTHSLEGTDPEVFYFPKQGMRELLRAMSLVVRTANDPTGLASSLRRTLAAIDPDLPLTHIVTMQTLVSNSAVAKRWLTGILAAFALMSVALAAAGIFSSLAYQVILRRREFGIRQALGAGRRSIGWIIVRQGMTVVGIGVATGVGCAIGATRLIQGWLYGVSATDPLVFTAMIAALIGAALIACAVPAWRAMRIDPLTAMRAD